MIGYHFTANRLRNGNPVPPVGTRLIYYGRLVPCQSGLHASEHPFDALRYAPGPILHLVELSGECIPHGQPVDKYVGRCRTILKTIDATNLLQRFVCDCTKAPLEKGKTVTATWKVVWEAASVAAETSVLMSYGAALEKHIITFLKREKVKSVMMAFGDQFKKLVDDAFAN